MFFLHPSDFADFTFNVIGVRELIFSGETVEVTVCENVKIRSQFSPCLLRNKNRNFHKVWYVERTLTINMISLWTRADIPCLMHPIGGFESVSLKFM